MIADSDQLPSVVGGVAPILPDGTTGNDTAPFDPSAGRVVVLDFETTGLRADEDRAVSLALVEIVAGRRTGRELSFEFDPGRHVGKYATFVNGMVWKVDEESRRMFPSLGGFRGRWTMSAMRQDGKNWVPSGGLRNVTLLAGKPKFADRAEEIRDFIGNSVVAAHNAAFDMQFMNAELVRARRLPLSNPTICTRAVMFSAFGQPEFSFEQARAPLTPDFFTGYDLRPFGKPSLRGTKLDDAAAFFGVDTSERGADGSLHGALADARICADVLCEALRRGHVEWHANMMLTNGKLGTLAADWLLDRCRARLDTGDFVVSDGTSLPALALGTPERLLKLEGRLVKRLTPEEPERLTPGMLPSPWS